MRKPSTFNVEERRKQKRLDREADIVRLDRDEIGGEELNERNGFFSVLDRSKLRIVQWRTRVKPATRRTFIPFAGLYGPSLSIALASFRRLAPWRRQQWHRKRTTTRGNSRSLIWSFGSFID